MPIEVTDYINVKEKLEGFGCQLPDSGLALLPINLNTATSVTDLRNAAEASTIRKLMLGAGLPLSDIVERDKRPPYVKNKNADLILPVLFISSSLISQNPALFSIALNVISNYVYDQFRALTPGRTVKFEAVVGQENSEKYRRISYEGTEEGLKALPEVIREAFK